MACVADPALRARGRGPEPHAGGRAEAHGEVVGEQVDRPPEDAGPRGTGRIPTAGALGRVLVWLDVGWCILTDFGAF